MRFATYLGPSLVIALGLLLPGCNGNAPATRARTPDPQSTTNRLVVQIDEERKISVRESGAILWDKGTPARIDERGRVTDRWGKLLAWLHNDNIRLRGGVAIPIRTSASGELFLSHKSQTEAGLSLLEARVGGDGSIVPGEGRVATMKMEGAGTVENRRLALLLLFMLHNDLLSGGQSESSDSEPSRELSPP